MPNFSNLNFDNEVNINSREIEYNIKNFYMNDIISRSSSTMAKCTQEIINKVA